MAFVFSPSLYLVIGGIFTSLYPAQSQSVITFDNPWLDDTFLTYKAYNEAEISFQVVSEISGAYTRLQRVGGGFSASTPYNGTPYMQFELQYYVNDEHARFIHSSGKTFGVISADLANPLFFSTPHTDIQFIGLKFDGSTVTNTVNGTANFINYKFSSEFASDLLKIDIPSPNWAMDNLVIVPEPSATSLLVIGLIIFGGWAKSKRHNFPTLK